MPRPRKDRKEPYIRRRTLARGGEAFDVRVPANPDANGGRPVNALTFYAMDDAVAWRDEQLALFRRGEAVKQAPDTLAVLLRRWLDDEAAQRVRASTLADYRETIENHLIPRLGETRADKLGAADAHKLLADMERAGVGCRTRQLALLRLKQCLKWAAGVELLRRNVAEKVKPPKCVVREGRVLTAAEQRDFLRAAKSDPLWPLWRVYLMTGLRRGEGLGLRWGDIDVANGRLSVHQSIQLVKDGGNAKLRPRVGEPKSAAARRSIDLDGETKQSLIDLRVRREAGIGSRLARHDLIFCTGHGSPLNPNNVYRNFERICEDAGLDITLHDLRHTHLTACVEAGMDWLAVASRAGHEDPAITHGTYGHHRPGKERDIIDRLAAELGGDETPGLGAG